MTNGPEDNPANTSDGSTPATHHTRSTLSVDGIFDLLASNQRREILRHLSASADSTATVDELVTLLLDHETQRTGAGPGRVQIEMTFHHVHLPKLTDADVVEYDARSQELRYWSDDRLEDLLEYVTEWDPE